MRKSRKYCLRIGRILPVYEYMLPMWYIGTTNSYVRMDVEVLQMHCGCESSFSHLASATGFFHGTLSFSSIGETLDGLNMIPPALICSTRNSCLVIKKADA